MATATPLPTTSADARARGEIRRGRFHLERALSPLLLSPSMIALFVFVYGFIGYTVWVSLSNWKTNRRDLSLKDPLYGTYDTLFSQNRFQIDLRNTFVFTVIFLVALVGGVVALKFLH